ncbi:TPA: hypothetical protein QDZ99_004778 [Stenotrophomonas maltophilia]|nr:hypothetical protein [Stenotrophomonas maltophilia]HDS1158922.1 hypothetical protein [Stenotrophomonas maltophilia]HDS1166178.1 hypothetical protein [Stenotrophomonas maltophilia]HDS1173008.1 hypothetical protein [Stenotrophomonas maltophilia]HDS1176859.1 hypothetical protein [Stenotrophomonas maltophilia]
MYIPLEHSLSRGMNMQDINSLLDACKVAAGVSSDNQLAAALGVGRSAISNYRHARALPDPVVCATIAGLSGIPLARVLGIVGEARAISREEKAVWRKLAATAMALCLAVGFALPRDVQAMPQAGNALHDIHYAQCCIGLPQRSYPPHGNGWASGSALACALNPRPRMRSRHD